MHAIAENPVDNTTRWRFVVSALFVIAGAAIAAVLLDSEPAAAHCDGFIGEFGGCHGGTQHSHPPPPPPPPPCQPWPNCNQNPPPPPPQCQPWPNCNQNPPPPPPPPPPQCPVGTTGTPPNCALVEDDDEEFDEDPDLEEVEDDDTYSPDDTASGRCAGSDRLVGGVCRPLTEQELEDDDGNTRVQCIRRDGELHTTTFLAVVPPGCPASSVGADVSISDPFWQEVWDDRCVAEGGGGWDGTLNGGAGGCTGLVDSDGNNQNPCFDGEAWVIVDALALCALVGEEEAVGCWDTIIERAQFVYYAIDDLTQFCSKIPDDATRSRCERRLLPASSP